MSLEQISDYSKKEMSKWEEYVGNVGEIVIFESCQDVQYFYQKEKKKGFWIVKIRVNNDDRWFFANDILFARMLQTKKFKFSINDKGFPSVTVV